MACRTDGWVDDQERAGLTPLMLVVSGGGSSEDIVRVLLRHGANLDVRSVSTSYRPFLS